MGAHHYLHVHIGGGDCQHASHRHSVGMAHSVGSQQTSHGVDHDVAEQDAPVIRGEAHDQDRVRRHAVVRSCFPENNWARSFVQWCRQRQLRGTRQSLELQGKKISHVTTL